ncbi:hypothetical protein LTR53_002210 [Teratosphaeriaceae sp. CCFEE 6253]|nr:hypothetical protein LTR53_002210 [Teratosphaeriaceae sp. CCFEE 6253]
MRTLHGFVRLAIVAFTVRGHCDSASQLLATVNIGLLLPTSSAYSSSLSNTTVTSNATTAIVEHGLPAASRCNEERLSYSRASREWEAVVTDPASCSTTHYSIKVTGIDSAVSIDWTTLCDGHPRTPSGFIYPTTTEWATIAAYTCANTSRQHAGTYPSPSPSCTIAPSDCGVLYEDNVMRATNGPITPLCSTPQSFNPPCGECTIFANGMQLFYWPVAQSPSDSCHANGSRIAVTSPPEAMVPRVLVTAYMSFTDIFATGANQANCGTAVANFEVPIQVDALSTLSCYPVSPTGASIAWVTQSMDLADMNYPVPWSAYAAMPGCAFEPASCDTMSKDYMPQLVLPTWLTGLQLQWASCSMSTGVYDPPVALSRQSQVDSPTVPTTASAPAYSSPTPGTSIAVVLPTNTGSATIAVEPSTLVSDTYTVLNVVPTSATATATTPLLSGNANPAISSAPLSSSGSLLGPTSKSPLKTTANGSPSMESAGAWQETTELESPFSQPDPVISAAPSKLPPTSLNGVTLESTSILSTTIEADPDIGNLLSAMQAVTDAIASSTAQDPDINGLMGSVALPSVTVMSVKSASHTSPNRVSPQADPSSLSQLAHSTTAGYESWTATLPPASYTSDAGEVIASAILLGLSHSPANTGPLSFSTETIGSSSDPFIASALGTTTPMLSSHIRSPAATIIAQPSTEHRQSDLTTQSVLVGTPSQVSSSSPTASSAAEQGSGLEGWLVCYLGLLYAVAQL